MTIGYQWYSASVRMINEVTSNVPSATVSNNVCLNYGVLTTTGENVSQSENAIGQVTRLKREADVQTAGRTERLGPSSEPSFKP